MHVHVEGEAANGRDMAYGVSAVVGVAMCPHYLWRVSESRCQRPSPGYPSICSRIAGRVLWEGATWDRVGWLVGIAGLSAARAHSRHCSSRRGRRWGDEDMRQPDGRPVG